MYLLKMYREGGKERVGEEALKQADRRRRIMKAWTAKHSKNTSAKNKQAMGCQALAQQRYFPLCAQLDLLDGEQYSPLFSQTLTQAGEFSSSMLGRFKNSTG